jgi:hypothetical protein
MKRLIYQVYTGPRKRLYDHCTKSVATYCKEHGIDHIIQTEPILRIKPDVFLTNRSTESYGKHGGFLPIYEKENAFGYFDRYDQIAIVDGDIWIRPDSPNIFDELDDDTEFAGVIERQMPLTPRYFQKITNYSRMQYQTLKHIDWKWDHHGGEFYNMGMMLMSNKIAKYLHGQTPKEQTLLNTWVREEKMKQKHLHWKWNGLFNAIPHEKMQQAHFLHFFHKDLIPNEGENIEALMKLVI